LAVKVKVPDVVTGLPETVNIDGAASPTLVTVPIPPPPAVVSIIFPLASTLKP